jgi:hypothetical protein
LARAASQKTCSAFSSVCSGDSQTPSIWALQHRIGWPPQNSESGILPAFPVNIQDHGGTHYDKHDRSEQQERDK